MLFNSYIFLFVFLPVTYAVFWSLRTASARYVWLTLTGYVFYGYWDPRFCLLMAFSTVVSYSAGLALRRYKSPIARKLCLIVPITIDLLLLGYFKYASFALSTLDAVSRSAGLGWSFQIPDIILPVGISFYTFHTITYIVDAYRGIITPTRNLFEFSAYVSLFSQLVAGPIVRFRQIETDLEDIAAADRMRWLPLGASFFIYGLAEKVLVADALAGLVDPALTQYRELSTAGAWAAMLGYSVQLYFDFCGYSDMAVGLGYMFGLRIPQNFNSPYKAVDPSDFWRRWHISLSTCLRDYLYIPLGGSRYGRLMTYRNLFITMLIGGLWHGANWTFVVWGAYHGVLLIGYRLTSAAWDRLPAIARQLGTFTLVLIGWVFFRAVNMTMATEILSKMFTPSYGVVVGSPVAWMITLGGALLWAAAGPNAYDVHEDFRWRRRHGVLLAAVFGACLAVMAGNSGSPFLYFQF